MQIVTGWYFTYGISGLFVIQIIYMYLLVRARFHLRVTINFCRETVRQSILVVAIYDAVDPTIVMAIQAVVFLNAVMIDISC